MMDSRDISQLSDDDSSVERYIQSNRRQKIRVFDRNLHQRNCPTYMNFTLDSSDTSDEEFAAPQNKLFEPALPESTHSHTAETAKKPHNPNIIEIGSDSDDDVIVVDAGPQIQYRHIYYNPAESDNEIVPWRRGTAYFEDKCNIDRPVEVKCLETGSKKFIQQYNIAPTAVQAEFFKEGARVIAQRQIQRLPYIKERAENVRKEYSGFYPGYIAEQAKLESRGRYLIIFDDGHVQYIRKRHMRRVCGDAEYIHPHGRKFRKFYLNYSRVTENYGPNTNMLQLLDAEVGKSYTVELFGRWEKAMVLQLDCKLIQIRFEKSKRIEWLLRGSPRLLVIWQHIVRNARFVDNSANICETSVVDLSVDSDDAADDDSNLNESTLLANPKREQRRYRTLNIGKTRRCSIPYRPHICSKECVEYAERNGIPNDLKANATMLVRPILMGWERKMDLSKFVYITPCGVTLRKIREVYRYLVATKSSLSIDCFTFDEHVDCLRTCQTVFRQEYILEDDLSNGLEKFPIRVVNQRTDGRPDRFKYIVKNRLADSVPNYLNNSSMSCCDCNDNCADKSKCSCWQLTYDGKDYKLPGSFGYEYKRLYNEVKTGIFECNSNCKCSQTQCLNRVAQNPIDHKLELFKTKNCGWGIRTLVDIPAGSFICCYFGEILDDLVDYRSDISGDEYFARLNNFIEWAEFHKDGYEENAKESNDDECSKKRTCTTDSDSESSDFDTLTASERPDAKTAKGEKDAMVNLYPYQYRNKEYEVTNATRAMIDDNPTDYVIDGKHHGNIGRFFNHSCEPNTFAQHIFADTHDLRFPWYGLFSANSIKAGEELTWDYNYEIIESSSRQIMCKCGSKECRGRLL